MGADFLYYALTWANDKKLNWDAGFKLIKTLDDEALEDNCVSKETLTEDLEYIKDIIVNQNYPRDMSITNIAHLNVLFTGGMSWGDDPSDTHRIISNLCCGSDPYILEAVGFWIDDYDYKKILMKVLDDHPEILPTLIKIDEHMDNIISQRLKKEK